MTLEPFAARLLIASRGRLIEEILRLRGELAASERDRDRHDATVVLWEQATADRELLRAELAAAQAERDEAQAANARSNREWLTTAQQLKAERDTARAEREAMRPVVEAAISIVECWQDDALPNKYVKIEGLEVAVDAYRKLAAPTRKEG